MSHKHMLCLKAFGTMIAGFVMSGLVECATSAMVYSGEWSETRATAGAVAILSIWAFGRIYRLEQQRKEPE